VRASFAVGRLGLSAFTEGKSADSISRTDITASFAPLSFINVLASIGRASDHRARDSSVTAQYLRGEIGFRVHDLWLLGGLLRRDSVALAPPIIYDTVFARVSEGPATGITAAVRGRVWKIIHADVEAVRWSDTLGYYRPRYQARSELFIRTNWLNRFPSGNLGILAALIHEYRSNVRFPVGVRTITGSDTTLTINPATAIGYRTIGTQLEIRIRNGSTQATAFWQFRNLLGERYAQVPTFLMPRQTNIYGVRWSFVD
jgi:hypothetical protein